MRFGPIRIWVAGIYCFARIINLLVYVYYIITCMYNNYKYYDFTCVYVCMCVYAHVFFSVVVSCREGTTCLAPNLFTRDSLPPTNVTVTNTSLEVWWGLPSLEACCAAVVFSYPLVQYRYQLIDVSGILFDLEVSKHYKVEPALWLCLIFIHVHCSIVPRLSHHTRTCIASDDL